MALTRRATIMSVTFVTLVAVALIMGNQRLAYASDDPLPPDSVDPLTPGTPADPGLPTQCSDGIDNDGDGLIDFVPVVGDPGCSSIYDNDETDAPPPQPPPVATEDTLALCSDGIDNDDDGKIDLQDSDCVSFKPKLTVTKVVVNDNGGSKVASDFILKVGSTEVTSGVEHTFDAGSFTVSENSDSSYVGTFSDDCNSSGNIALAPGDVKHCTLTNDDVAIGGGGGSYSEGSYYSQGSYGGGGGGSYSQASYGGGGGGGGDGSNGPIVGSFTPGVVLGVSTGGLPIVSCDMYLTVFIKPGGNNDPDQVKRLQKILIDFENASTTESGIYDGATLAAVNAFQTKYASEILAPWGISKSTGFVYLTSRKKVNELYCKASGQTFPLSESELQVITSTKVKTAEHVSPISVTEVVPTPVPAAGVELPTTQTEITVPPQTNENVTGGVLQKALRPISDFFSRLFKRAR